MVSALLENIWRVGLPLGSMPPDLCVKLRWACCPLSYSLRVALCCHSCRLALAGLLPMSARGRDSYAPLKLSDLSVGEIISSRVDGVRPAGHSQTS